MLVIDPKQRISVENALNHPFLKHLHDSTEEPVEKEPVCAYDFDFELYSLTIPELKKEVYKEMCLHFS
jgi:mitogen-activated protein kinase 1/3